MKTCNRCERTLLASQFWKDCKRKDGLARVCADCAKMRWRVNTHGVTEERIHEMLVEQDFNCPICDEDITNDYHIDHDHACCPDPTHTRRRKNCGQCVRGLLCRLCNVGLGSFRDDPALLARAIDFLKVKV